MLSLYSVSMPSIVVPRAVEEHGGGTVARMTKHSAAWAKRMANLDEPCDTKATQGTFHTWLSVICEETKVENCDAVTHQRFDDSENKPSRMQSALSVASQST